ncbi:MAG: VWA domain-containing protein [Fimbriimonadaceae bacterium]|nr:VWA domain-containing protein [Fimbriimonadaceae bacterium]
MVERLSGFARALRAAGLGVSPAEVQDAARALAAVEVAERTVVRDVLAACLVKSAEHRPAFERLFESWFLVPWPPGEVGTRKRRSRQRPTEQGQQRGRGRGQSVVPPEQPQETGQAPQPGEQPRDGRQQSSLARQQGELQAQAQAARERHALQQQRAAGLAQRPLWRRCPADEATALDRECERLGRLLVTRHGRRTRRDARGHVDLRSTIARAARTYGVPWPLLRRRRRVSQTRLLVLCDVSGSVIRAARFLLRLLHTTGRLFDRTTGFVFVDRPVPAASLFRQADFDQALADLERLPGLDLHALSDFGHLAVRLLDQHAPLLTATTTLLVLGDARCNRFDPQVWAWEQLAARVAQIVWLNPERRDRWYTADSRLRELEPHLTHLLPATTLADLAAAIGELLARPAPPR